MENAKSVFTITHGESVQLAERFSFGSRVFVSFEKTRRSRINMSKKVSCSGQCLRVETFHAPMVCVSTPNLRTFRLSATFDTNSTLILNDQRNQSFA